MRPPNEHPPTLALPERLTDLLMPAKAQPVVTKDGTLMGPGPTVPTRYLRKVKGLQPLQIELSWMCVCVSRTLARRELMVDGQPLQVRPDGTYRRRGCECRQRCSRSTCQVYRPTTGRDCLKAGGAS